MQIRVGYELHYECPQPLPMILMLQMHPSRDGSVIVPEMLRTDPYVPRSHYIDMFGNRCTRLVAPPGRISLTSNAIVSDSGLPEPVVPYARQWPVEALPDDTLLYLLGSRYCETDRMSDIAWQIFGGTPEGWPRVQAIVDFVHNHLTFGYRYARSTKTAWDAFQERVGVCRDFAHLAITLCRCMNIPARYCTGYLGDIGVPAVPDPMDFSGWFEAFLDGIWYTFDARHNKPRIGRVLMGRGRDAADVPISHTFGSNLLVQFQVWTDELREAA